MFPLKGIFEKGNYLIDYMFKDFEQDKKHLLVVFSGFGSNKSIDYDFVGTTSENLKSAILWISDDFDGECAYYLCRNGKVNIENDVMSLIEMHLDSMGLNKSKCTLMGFSKGGTAALYYGIKFGFKNIISSVPQTKISSYVKENWKSVYHHMFGDARPDFVNDVDNLLIDLFKNSKDTEKNIYLFTSKSDKQYHDEIEPALIYLPRFSNFNLVLTSSDLVCEHNKVTRYNLPFILGVVNMLIDNVVPKFGFALNGVVSNLKEIKCEMTRQQLLLFHVFNLETLFFKGGVLFIKGVSFVRGFECAGFADISHKLIVFSNDNKYELSLSKNLLNDLNYSYFYRVKLDYKSGNFTTPKNQGLVLPDIVIGEYKLQIITSVTANKKVFVEKNIYCDNLNTSIFVRNGLHFSFENRLGVTMLIVKEL